jgi:hypothetical protein
MEGEIGKIYLWQDKDQNKQEKLEKQDAPAPSPHTNLPREQDSIPTHPSCQRMVTRLQLYRRKKVHALQHSISKNL